MRTEQEIKRAAELHAKYVAAGGLSRLEQKDPESAQNMTGVIACLEWVLGDGAGNPVHDTLADLEKHLGRPERQ